MNLNEFIRKRKHLIWYVNNTNNLNKEAIVESTLNYGNWEDVQELFKILGIKTVAEIFKAQTYNKSRINYRPKTINFFKLYFEKHA